MDDWIKIWGIHMEPENCIVQSKAIKKKKKKIMKLE
jgi:hypothetical protein